MDDVVGRLHPQRGRISTYVAELLTDKTIDPAFVAEINSPPSFFPNRRFWLPIEAAIRPVESLNHQPGSSREAV